MTAEKWLLVVEDEPLILEMVSSTLEDGGFATLVAGDGAEAVRIVNERHPQLAGLVTDIRLGAGPDGWEVARRARELSADLPILYITGDSADKWTSCGVPKSGLVQKPFAAAQILVAVAGLVEGRSASPQG
ncbi:MAG TPA: response regulator [Sphingomonas sp.]|nr:response regulator [Sphingomonas sp.]